MDSQKEKKHPFFYILLGGVVAAAGIAVIAVSLVYGFTFPEFTNDQEKFAQFGDFFGGILNPILSFLTVALLVGSLALQRVELSKVVEELELTRKVHLSSVNMNHWEHILKCVENGDSQILHSLQTFKDILDTEISLVKFGPQGCTRSAPYKIYKVFSKTELLSQALSNGYWSERASVKESYIQNTREFSDFTVRLNTNLKLMTDEIAQLKDLGCPKLRVKELLQAGNDLLDDYFGSGSSQTFRENIISQLPAYAAFSAAFINYPDNLGSV